MSNPKSPIPIIDVSSLFGDGGPAQAEMDQAIDQALQTYRGFTISLIETLRKTGRA